MDKSHTVTKVLNIMMEELSFSKILKIFSCPISNVCFNVGLQLKSAKIVVEAAPKINFSIRNENHY